MEVEIINYNDISQLKKHEKYDLIKDTLHICAAASTTEGMYQTYGEEFKKPIISIGNITKYISDDWDSSVVKLGQYTRLTRAIKELTKELEDDILFKSKYEKVLRGIRRNQKEILNSMRSLIECNVYPEDFNPTTLEEEFFVELWMRAELAEKDESIIKFRNEIFKNLNDEKVFETKLKGAISYAINKEKDKIESVSRKNKLEEYKSNIESEKIEKIVLHGFYYIRPIQDRIIELMKNMKIKIIFLNWYDEKYTKVFEIWDKTFDIEWGYPIKDKWTYSNNKKQYRMCDLFADIYQGTVTQENIEDIKKVIKPKLKKFDDTISFIDNYNENHMYYSPDSNKMNDIFKDYYPEKYDNRHFLSYPIGQYLYQIHKMWDEDLGTLKIDMDGLQECFSSGWLNINKNNQRINAIDYTYDLHLIKTYFKGCHIIDEWKDRLKLLKQIKEEVVDKLNTDIDKSDKNYRFHQVASNPLINFSFFKIDTNRVEIILEFIEVILQTAQKLFEDNKEIDLNKYLKKIEKLIDENSFEFINEVEEEIVSKLKDKLCVELDYKIYCYPEDIAEALVLFLGGDFEKTDEEEKDKQSNKIVQPIEKIEAASITNINDNKWVHICQLSEEAVPGASRGYSWPLNKENLNRIKKVNRKYSNRLLDRMILIIEETGSINRYLFYCLLHASKNLELSWITNWEDKILDESVYIKLLKTWIKDFDTQQEKDTIDIGKENTIKYICNEHMKKEEIDNLLIEGLDEYKICPRRFYYSYILDDYPTYKSDFHHGFVFTGVIKSLAIAASCKPSDAFNQIEQFFPQWNSIEKQQLKEYSERYKVTNKTNYDLFNGRFYISNRTTPHFLMYKHSNFFNKDGYSLGEIKKDTSCGIFKAKPERGDKCMYCPHRDYCRFAILPLDREEEQ